MTDLTSPVTKNCAAHNCTSEILSPIFITRIFSSIVCNFVKMAKRPSRSYVLDTSLEADISLEAPVRDKLQKRLPNKKVEWEFLEEFPSKRAAIDYLVGEKIWAHHFTNKPNKKGVNSIYRCTNVPRRGIQCPSKRKIECPKQCNHRKYV